MKAKELEVGDYFVHPGQKDFQVFQVKKLGWPGVSETEAWTVNRVYGDYGRSLDGIFWTDFHSDVRLVLDVVLTGEYDQK